MSKDTQASPSRRIDSRTFHAITGLNTLSWKLPCEPAKPTVASLPNTWVATMVIASHWVGLTLPGMMEEPGSFSGISSSPMPLRGPEAYQRTSFAIFMSASARTRSAPDTRTRASWAPSAAKRLSACLKAIPVSSEIFSAVSSPNFGCAFRPVPTAVPPMASSRARESAYSMPSRAKSICATHPEMTWPRRIGVASCRWVRPTMMTSSNSFAFPSRVSRSWRTRGYMSCSSETTAMCMAVGKVSFEDWPRFTWSLGWTGFLEPSAPPASSMARLEMTSLAFMFDWVPEPVWKTTRGKWSSSLPEITSSPARAIRSAMSRGSSPSSAFARAADFLRMPRARTMGRPHTKVLRPMSKLWRDRSVCAPQ